MLDAAAISEPVLIGLQRQLAEQRRHGQGRLADKLSGMGALRAELPVDRARDIVWTLCAQATFDALVTTCGWSHADYARWLAGMLTAALLEP